MRVGGWLWLLLIASGLRAAPIELHLYQRGYVEGGRDAATSLTNQAVAVFTRRHPEYAVRVVGVPWGQEGDLKLRTALLARRRIDVFRTTADELPAFLSRHGQLLAPIDAQLSPEDRADFGSTLEAVEHGGQHWAWPLWSTAIVLVANPVLLERAGVHLPPHGKAWTWNEFVAALERLQGQRTAKGETVISFNAAARPPLFEYAPLLMAHAGLLFTTGTAEGEHVLRPGVRGALERMAELRRRGLLTESFGVDDQPAVQAQFMAGRLALLMTTPGFLKTLANKNMPAVVLPPPIGDYGRVITTGGLGCFAVVDSERAGAAHELARWLTGHEITMVVPGWYLAPPARQSVANFYTGPLLGPLRQIVTHARYQVPPGGLGYLNNAILPQFQAVLLGRAGDWTK